MTAAKGRIGSTGHAIINEAMNVIAESGVEALNLRELARRAQISPQAPYKHFKSREHLVAEVVRRSFEQFVSTLDAVPRSRNPHRDLKALGKAYLKYVEQHPESYRLMFGTPLPDAKEHPEMMQGASRVFTLLRACVNRMHSSSSKKSVRDSSEVTTMFVWSVLHGVASMLQTKAARGLGLLPRTLAATPTQALKRIDTALASLHPH